MAGQSYKITMNQEGHIGYALVINNSNFSSAKPRTGSEKDVENVGKSLAKLRFKVHEPLLDLTKRKIRIKLDEIIETVDFSKYTCLVCVIMSYGDLNGKILGANGKSADLNSFVINVFNDCEQLNGKPKLFLVQACAGYEGDSNKTSISVYLPKDVLVYYSTEEKFIRVENEENNEIKGSAFFLALCKEMDKFDKYDKMIEITELLQKVTKTVENNFNCEPPQFLSSLSKSVFLNSIYEIRKNKQGQIGCALVINNYAGATQFQRLGFHKDEDRFKKELVKLNLQVLPYLGQKTEKIKNCAKKTDFTLYSLFVCIFYTPDLTKFCAGDDFSTIENSFSFFFNDLIEPFLSSASLKGKPKLFVIDFPFHEKLQALFEEKLKLEHDVLVYYGLGQTSGEPSSRHKFIDIVCDMLKESSRNDEDLFKLFELNDALQIREVNDGGATQRYFYKMHVFNRAPKSFHFTPDSSPGGDLMSEIRGDENNTRQSRAAFTNYPSVNVMSTRLL